MLTKNYYVYIITNYKNSVLYTGVTDDITRRDYEYRHKVNDGFTKKYNAYKLVYFEHTNDVYSALAREKQIKHYKREEKIKLISKNNPNFQDLYKSICG